MKVRIPGISSQMNRFRYLYGIILGELLLKHLNNLSWTLQHTSLLPQVVYVDEAVETLNGIRGDEQVDLFRTKVTSKAGAVDVGEPALPRRRKSPIWFDDMLCEGDFPETTSTNNKFASNCSCWTLISMYWQYMELWISFTSKSSFCHSARDSGRTSPVHSRHSANECYIGEIVHSATTSQKILAHHDAAGTSELSDVAPRSQGMNRCSGHASSVRPNIIHWRFGASVRHLLFQWCGVLTIGM